MTSEPLLSVTGLTKHFPVKRGIVFQSAVGTVRAVDGLTFYVAPGETLAIVGESGCGKSTTGRLVLRLIEATEGTIRFAGRDVRGLGRGALRDLRRDMQIIFQDPYASLNPRLTVGETLAEPLRLHGLASGAALRRRIANDWPDLARDGLIDHEATLPALNAAPGVAGLRGALHLAYSNYHLTNPVARASATMAACVSSLIVVQEAAE